MSSKIISKHHHQRNRGCWKHRISFSSVGDISCNKLLFSMFKKGKKLKLCFSIRGKIWQETWYGEENKCFTSRRVFKHHQPGWLGESVEDRTWHSWGETLIGDCVAEPASVVSQVCEFGPPLAKGAEMDHVETGTQGNCIWKANFPGCWRLKMSNCLRKQTLWPHRCMQWSFQDVPNITACSSWHNLPLPNPQILPQYPKNRSKWEGNFET